MKKIYILFYLSGIMLRTDITKAQLAIEDRAMRYQQERMVFKQWDKGKFEPTPGFLWTNPYYWMTWGLHPNYPDTDRRPLSAWGPQTQRLGIVGALNSTSGAYRLDADTLRNTALLEVSNYSGAVSGADPLWLLYYSKELRPVLEYSPASILNPLPVAVRGRVISEGIYDWYLGELGILKERLIGARNANMDRGSRIVAYHRLLAEYRKLAGVWNVRTAGAANKIRLGEVPIKVKVAEAGIEAWHSGSDVDIARQVISNRKY